MPALVTIFIKEKISRRRYQIGFPLSKDDTVILSGMAEKVWALHLLANNKDKETN
ncbi:MAG: hypothetical protein ABI266_00490 [Ginsengibacter sp.]